MKHIPVFRNSSVQRDDIANLDLGTNRSAKDEQTLAGRGVLIRLSRPEEDAIGANRRDETFETNDILVVQGRQEFIAIDLGNGDGGSSAGGSEEGRDELHGERLCAR